jgi:hypothetical protein
MDCVKYYISLDEYKNLILVNKEYYQIFSNVKEPLMLSYILKKEGLFHRSAFDFIKKKLNGFESIKLLIECLEVKTKFNEDRLIIYKPLNWCKCMQIKKRLNYLNLLGF